MRVIHSSQSPYRYLLALAVLVGLTVWLISPVVAQSQRWQEINQGVMDGHIIPAYVVLAEAGEQLSERVDGFCSNTDKTPEAINEMRAAWHSAMDAWQSVQHIRFGPVSYFNWQYRLQYWPDERATGLRQLTALLAAADPAILDEETFADQSVGVQGLPALEILLFDEESDALLENGYRCQVAQAIANNIATMSQNIVTRWQQEFRATLMLSDDSGWFRDHSDASTELLKALVESVPLLTTQKLALPMGENAERARLRRAESWRSARSLRNIQLNVAALYDLYQGQGDWQGLTVIFPEAHSMMIDEHFATVNGLINELPASFETALDETEQGYARLVTVAGSLDALYQALEAGVKDTELFLGFNSLDGD